MLLTTKGTDRAGMRIAWWAARLLCFNYSVEYRAGSENHTADRFSRLPLPLASDAELDTEPEFDALVSTGPIAIPQDVVNVSLLGKYQKTLNFQTTEHEKESLSQH